MTRYEKLRAQVREARSKGLIDLEMTREQKIDWVFGNTAIENDGITRELVEQVVDAAAAGQSR